MELGASATDGMRASATGIAEKVPATIGAVLVHATGVAGGVPAIEVAGEVPAIEIAGGGVRATGAVVAIEYKQQA